MFRQLAIGNSPPAPTQPNHAHHQACANIVAACKSILYPPGSFRTGNVHGADSHFAFGTDDFEGSLATLTLNGFREDAAEDDPMRVIVRRDHNRLHTRFARSGKLSSNRSQFHRCGWLRTSDQE
jgi:hypothetical protein